MKIFIVLLSLSASLLLSGCGYMKPVHRENSSQTIDSYYQQGDIRSIAILPAINIKRITPKDVNEDLSAFYEQLYLSTKQGLFSKNPQLKIFLPNEILNRLTMSSERTSLRLFQNNLEKGITPKREEIILFKKILNVDSIFIPIFSEIHQNHGHAPGKGRGHARVKTDLQIYDLNSGFRIWKGNTEEWFATSGFGFHDALPLKQPMEGTFIKVKKLMPML